MYFIIDIAIVGQYLGEIAIFTNSVKCVNIKTGVCMISKILRNGQDGYYDLKVTDMNGRSFIMTVGGNLDLYWIPENYKECMRFEISNDDKIVYSIFEQLFNAVEKNNDKHMPVLNDNVITFISEDWPEEECNKLKIIKNENSFVIDFIKNENTDAWTYPHRGCTICFCNSGSRVPRVESLFMRMFNYLAYECDLIKCNDNRLENQL